MTENYEVFRNIVPKEKFFEEWLDESIKKLSNKNKERIYNEYLIRCKTFQRDDFKCQNLECTGHCTEITFHHIIFQCDGGKWTVDNGVTLCDSCHKRYHRCKSGLVFSDNIKLPKLIRGKTLECLEKPEKTKWKEFKKDMKKLRNKYKFLHEYLTLEELEDLLRWFFSQYDD